MKTVYFYLSLVTSQWTNNLSLTTTHFPGHGSTYQHQPPHSPSSLHIIYKHAALLVHNRIAGREASVIRSISRPFERNRDNVSLLKIGVYGACYCDLLRFFDGREQFGTPSEQEAGSMV